MSQWVIPLAALAISALTLVLSQVNFRHTAKRDYVIQLEHRIDALEKELARHEAENAALARENTLLLRQLAGIADTPRPG